MCGVRRFRRGGTGDSGRRGVRAFCPYAAKLTTTFARIQSFDAPRAVAAGGHALPVRVFSARQAGVEFATPFFGPSKRGPPSLFL